MRDARDEAFIEELTALSKKYRVIIGGCGCCDSPYLVDFDFSVEHLWQDELDKDIEKNCYYMNEDCGNLRFKKVAEEKFDNAK